MTLPKEERTMPSTPKPKVNQELVDAARETLEALPPPSKKAKLLSLKEAITALSPTIRRLLQRGHSREDVVQLLREQGIECTVSTFKSIYRASKSKTSKTTARTLRASPTPPLLGQGSAGGTVTAGTGAARAVPPLPGGVERKTTVAAPPSAPIAKAS
jgi:hypothetical protein